MPYATLAELPAYVKSLSGKKKRQWRAVFNSVFSQTKNESRAFASANAIIKESADRDFDYIQDLSEAAGQSIINKEKGVIENVVILTGEKVSRNKTFYTKKAMLEAVTRYEGAKMYIDHPADKDQPVRSVRDLGGTYKNVRLDEGKFLRADLHLLPNENIRSLVLPIAEAKPVGVGLSIRDKGHGREEDGVFLVEGFAGKNGFSIDLVTEASVNENLFESTQGGNDMLEIEKLTLEELQEGNPALVEKIKTEERAAVMKSLEEKIKAGEDAQKALALAKKVSALAEANLPKEIVEATKKLIESEAVSFEMAQSIIKAQSDVVESLKPKGQPDPSVKGHGAGKDLSEAKEVTDDEILAALQ